jgi:hypothetical protein
MEVGTEDYPYTSKITITMHGERETAEIPIYGNKVIAVRFGTIDFHGVERSPTWTVLYESADIGANTITLNEAVDWEAGEEIAIASTDYTPWCAEQRTIVSVDNTDPDHPILELDSALECHHYAGSVSYGSDTLEMRAEVGLLTRNVKYQGDEDTSADNEFGAHIMLHSEGDESLTGRFEYVELYNVG